MNAETRAKELLTGMLDKVYCEGGDAFPIFEETLPLIAAAITRAENDKLEEAAAHFERYSAALSGRSFAATLRSLKSKD